MKNPFTTWRPTKEIMSPWQSDTPAPLWRARLQHRGLRAADLLSSPATCRPPWFLPAAPPYLPLPSADFTPRKQGLESRACRLGTAFIIQWPHASGFLRYWRLSDYKGGKKKKNRERCSPTLRCIFKKALPTPSPHQSTSQLLPFQYEGPPSKRKRHLAHAFQIKTVK